MTTLRKYMPRRGVLGSWDNIRNTKQVHWAMECFAEMLGIGIYIYCGVGATAGWVTGNILKVEGLSSLLHIGFGYAFGVFFALIVCAPTSGGHFNPAVTITFCIFKKFPVAKAVRYIIAQIIGAFIAVLLVYNQWKVLLDECEALLRALGPKEFAAIQFTPDGIPGIFVSYLPTTQSLPRAFMNEFVNCTLVAMIIWAALDPTNYLIPPVMLPMVIGFGYGTIIWGFGVPGLALNAARDFGARIFVMSVWGLRAAGGPYAAIACLTNIPATILAAFIYEFFLTDPDRAVTGSHMEYITYNMSHGKVQQERGKVTNIDLHIRDSPDKRNFSLTEDA